MKSKFALALDLLEQEVEVLSKEQQSQFFGGDDPYGSNGYDSNSSNGDGASIDPGNCYFQCLGHTAGMLNCGTTDYVYYKGAYTTVYDPEEDFSYNGAQFIGVNNSDHLNSFTQSTFNTTKLDTGLKLMNYVAAHPGQPIMSSMYTGDYANGDKTAHDVVIQNRNQYGQYEVWNPWTNQTETIDQGKIVIGATFGIDGCCQ